MKIPMCLLILVNTAMTFGQTSMVLDANNVKAYMQDDGSFFTRTLTSQAGCEIPSGSLNNTAFQMNFWMTAIESDNTGHAACHLGYEKDLFPGPISDNYNSPYYLSEYDTTIWKVTRDQINYHIGNFTATGYIPDGAISSWPGNGNGAEGIATQLAPYVDANNDQVYDPMDGDFPYIQGDAAVFVILNDEAGIHEHSGGIPLGVEIHAMFYQFASTDDVNNTTFMNVTIYNRRDTNYLDFMFGIYMDTDIGYANDDFIGSDSIRNLFYGYNATMSDPGGNGQPGYGSAVPAFGVKMLNANAGSVIGWNNTTGGGLPGFTMDSYYYAMKATNSVGEMMTDGTNPTRFFCHGNPYQGTGWNEVSAGHVSADRRGLISSVGAPFPANGSLCFDYAFVYNRETSDAWQNVDKLLTTSDFIQAYYDNEIQPCSHVFLDVVSHSQIPSILIYPNPTAGTITIQAPNDVLVSIHDLSGRLVFGPAHLEQASDKVMQLEQPGFYFVSIASEDGIITRKIEVLK